MGTDGSNVVGAIGALGALGIEAYQLSQGQQVSTTLGPGGASLIQSGPAVTQTSYGLLLGIAVAVLLVVWLLAR